MLMSPCPFTPSCQRAAEQLAASPCFPSSVWKMRSTMRASLRNAEGASAPQWSGVQQQMAPEDRISSRGLCINWQLNITGVPSKPRKRWEELLIECPCHTTQSMQRRRRSTAVRGRQELRAVLLLHRARAGNESSAAGSPPGWNAGRGRGREGA